MLGPQKDQLQVFRQECDTQRAEDTISLLAKRFYRGRLTPDIVQRALRLRSFSNDKRAVYVFPFVIPAEQLYFDGHLYEPVPIKDISVLIESGEIHDSSTNLLSKLDLEGLFNMAFETTPPHF